MPHSPLLNHAEVRQAAARSLVSLGQASEQVVAVLVMALGSYRYIFENYPVRQAAARSLGQLEQASKEVVAMLVGAIGDLDWRVREVATDSLVQLKIEDEAQQRAVLIALNRRLHDRDDDVRRAALAAIRRLLDGRQIPGYRWVPIREQQRRARIRKRIGWAVLALGLVVLALCIGGAANGQLDFAAGWVGWPG